MNEKMGFHVYKYQEYPYRIYKDKCFCFYIFIEMNLILWFMFIACSNYCFYLCKRKERLC